MTTHPVPVNIIIEDLPGLTMKQLRAICSAWGVAPARTRTTTIERLTDSGELFLQVRGSHSDLPVDVAAWFVPVDAVIEPEVVDLNSATTNTNPDQEVTDMITDAEISAAEADRALDHAIAAQEAALSYVAHWAEAPLTPIEALAYANPNHVGEEQKRSLQLQLRDRCGFPFWDKKTMPERPTNAVVVFDDENGQARTGILPLAVDTDDPYAVAPPHFEMPVDVDQVVWIWLRKGSPLFHEGAQIAAIRRAPIGSQTKESAVYLGRDDAARAHRLAWLADAGYADKLVTTQPGPARIRVRTPQGSQVIELKVAKDVASDSHRYLGLIKTYATLDAATEDFLLLRQSLFDGKAVARAELDGQAQALVANGTVDAELTADLVDAGQYSDDSPF